MLSDSHKQAIQTLKTIFKVIPSAIKKNNAIWKFNKSIDFKYKQLNKQVDEKEYKPYPQDWISSIPFIDVSEHKCQCGNKIEIIKSYGIEYNRQWYSAWDRKIFLTLLHIVYNRLRNKKRGHTKDDTAYIEKHKDYYKAICERSEMHQFLFENHKEPADANPCS